MQLNWTDELNTGIPEIDTQNRRIVEYANTLTAAKETGDSAQVGEVLEKLLDHAVNHFLFEEHLMEQAHYEFLAGHERIHELFAKKLADFRGRHAEGEDVADDLISMLTNWVNFHIRDEDQRYAASVNQVIEKEGGQSWVAGVMNKLFGV